MKMYERAIMYGRIEGLEIAMTAIQIRLQNPDITSQTNDELQFAYQQIEQSRINFQEQIEEDKRMKGENAE